MVIVKSQTGQTLKPASYQEAQYFLSHGWAFIERHKPMTIVLQDMIYDHLHILIGIREKFQLKNPKSAHLRPVKKLVRQPWER
jgi:hypothetical protein